MEGLRGVQYIKSEWGTRRIELDFLDPPATVIDALEYAMLNDLTFAIPGGVASGSLSPILMKIINIYITNETIDGGPAVFGGPPTYLSKVIHRHIRVHARPA